LNLILLFIHPQKAEFIVIFAGNVRIILKNIVRNMYKDKFICISKTILNGMEINKQISKETCK